MIFLEWTTFKTQVTNKALLRWEDRDTFYKISFGDFETSVLKSETPGADQTDFETNYKTLGNKTALSTIETSPFAAKKLNGKPLFKRVIGIKNAVTASSITSFEYTITHAWAKMKKIEIIGGELGDEVTFKVLDTPAGTYSGVPNYQLNQFGWTVNISKDYYAQDSEFDADMYAGIRLKFEYYSVSDKTARANIVLNEVV